MQVVKFIILIVFAYFFGNISFARILAKMNKQDITKSGSGNPGTMNMLRTNGFKYGLLTLMLDVFKGALPCLIGVFMFKNDGLVIEKIALFSAGLAVIVGHIYPICYKFKGGKGVACAIGIFLVSNPLWLIVIFAIAFVYLWFFDYGSIASFIVVSTMIIIEGFSKTSQQHILIPCLLFLIFTLIFFAHRANIYRLLVGKENKANLKKSIEKQLGKKKKQDKEIYKQEKSIVKADFIEDKQEYKEIKSYYKNNKQEFREQNVNTNSLNKEFRESKNEYKIKKARYKQDVSQIKKSYSNKVKQMKKGLSNQEIVKTTLSNLPNIKDE